MSDIVFSKDWQKDDRFQVVSKGPFLFCVLGRWGPNPTVRQLEGHEKLPPWNDRSHCGMKEWLVATPEDERKKEAENHGLKFFQSVENLRFHVFFHPSWCANKSRLNHGCKGFELRNRRGWENPPANTGDLFYGDGQPDCQELMDDDQIKLRRRWVSVALVRLWTLDLDYTQGGNI